MRGVVKSSVWVVVEWESGRLPFQSGLRCSLAVCAPFKTETLSTHITPLMQQYYTYLLPG